MRINDGYLGIVKKEDIKNGKFEIIEGLDSIGFEVFEDYNSLISIDIPSSIKNIYYRAFANCTNLKEITFSEGLIKIDASAFEGCRSLTNIKLPESLQILDICAFKDCINLENINIPKKIKQIGDKVFEESGTFMGCEKLKSIELPEGLITIGNNTFEGCRSLTNINIPKSVNVIGNNAFKDCQNLKKIKIPDGIEIINERSFEGCRSLTNINIPKNVREIRNFCFDGCSSLSSITIPKSVGNIGYCTFKGCSSLEEINVEEGNERYFSKDGVLYWKRKDKVLLIKYPCGKKDPSFTIPNGVYGVEEEAFLDCDYLKEIKFPEDVVIVDESFDYNSVMYDNEKKQIILKKENKISNANKYIPAAILPILSFSKKLSRIIQDSDFKAFNSNIPNLKNMLKYYSEEEQLDFFKFAICLGCFSKEKILDVDLRETEVSVGQKASALLAKLIKTQQLKLGQYHGLFNSLSLESTTSQEFLKFITPQGKKNDNVELLLKLERGKYPGIFAKVMNGFNNAKKYRNTLAEDGSTKTISWEEAFIKFYLENKYINVTENTQDIADEYSSKGLDQIVFDEGVKLREEAKTKNISNHILGKEIRELSILEKIEQLKQKTAEELEESKQIIDDLYKKQFTYEWLDKNDPKNGILGLYVSCCGTITSAYYGKEIARRSIIAEDVQNLVVRDASGEIISKGTIYVNEEYGYGVFNDFELNEKYREHEDRTDGYGGRYAGDNMKESELSVSQKKQREERDLIFSAFQRGILAFVEEYDSQHPDNPLNQINVGMGYNRLKRNVEKFEEETNLLTVPKEYEFKDAENAQFILYKREQRKIEKQQEDEEVIR